MTSTDTIIIVGSGPSLDKEQTNLINGTNKAIVMVVNDNYKVIDNPHHLFAADLKWWYRNYDLVKYSTICWSLDGHPNHLNKRIPGAKERILNVLYTREFGLYNDKVHHSGNSGYIAIQLARLLMYKKIILVGFDHQHTNGLRHWFGDHDKKYFQSNAEDVEGWTNWMNKLAPLILQDTQVINCSKQTSLECFPKMPLQDALDYLT